MGFPKNIKGIIFDFDGTIFDLAINWQGLNNELHQKYNTNSLDQLNNLSDTERREVIDKIGAAENLGVEQGHPKPDALATLNVLSTKLAVAVASRNNRETVKAGLDKIGFRKNMLIVGREDVESPKPHPEALQLALEGLGLEPSETIVVGDTSHDVEAAHAAGMKCVIVYNDKLTFTPKDADFYIKSLVQLHEIIKPNSV